MKITNEASFPVLAFGWLASKGYADDVLIGPGEAKDVNGPYLGEMDGGSCHVALIGEVTCQEAPDDVRGMQIGLGMPIHLGADDRGVTIRHHSDPPEDCVLEWRSSSLVHAK